MISKDIIRDENPWIKEEKVRYIENELIGECSKKWEDIVIDNTHMNTKSLASVHAFCKWLWYDVEIVDMIWEYRSPIDYLERSIEQNSERHWKKRVPTSVIYEMYLANFPTEFSWVGSIYVFDIDWTLADWSHREHLVSNWKKDWKWYFDLMSDDKCISPVWNILKTIRTVSALNTIVIVSWRPDSYCKQTEKWLKDKWIRYDFLLMRKSWDSRKDTEVKKEIYEKCLKKEHDKIVAVFDDRACVIDMRREQWLYVFNCSMKKDNNF